MATQIEFGTSGRRAVMAEEFTFDAAKWCKAGQVVGPTIEGGVCQSWFLLFD
jgi:hypothetical protein